MVVLVPLMAQLPRVPDLEAQREAMKKGKSECEFRTVLNYGDAQGGNDMQAAVVPAVSSSRQVKDVSNLSSDHIKCYTPILLGNAYRSTPISLPGDGHRAPQQNTNDPRAAWAA
jgi:hypothetical protein